MVYEATDRLGDYFTSRRERGITDLPTLSVTLTNGLVTRDSLDRKMETNLSDDEHLLVRKDDIVYNTMRMWQGASGLADRDGLLSPAYVVLAPKKGIYPLYASYLFKSSRLIYLFWAYSYGITNDRLRLYFNDFKNIPITIPSLPEQTKITEILSTWDKAVDKFEALISAKQKRKKALMQQLMTGKKRFNGFETKWKAYVLRDLGRTFNGLSGKNKEDFGFGKPYIPYLNIYRNNRIDIKHLEFVNIDDLDKQSNAKYGDIFFTTSSETPHEVGMSSVLLDNIDEIYLNSFCFGFRLEHFNTFHPEFARYLFRAEHIRRTISVLAQGATRYNLSKTQFLKIKLELPCIEEQQKIATILSSADKEITIHQNQLAALKQQKKALMQQLLTGKARVIA